MSVIPIINPQRPPKEWWNKCVKSTKKKTSTPEDLCGWVWHHETSPKKKRKIVRKYENPDGVTRQSPLNKGTKMEWSRMYQRGYDDAAIGFSYIPDFKNEKEKKDWQRGYKQGLKDSKENPDGVTRQSPLNKEPTMVRTRKKRRNARRKRVYRRVSRPVISRKRRNIPTRRRAIARLRNPAGSRHRLTVYKRGRKFYAPRGSGNAALSPGTRINRRKKTTARRRKYYRKNPRPTIRNIFSRRVINSSVKFAVGLGTGYMVIPVINKLLPADMKETGQFKWLGAVDFAIGALMTAFVKNKDVKDVGMVVAGLGVYDLIAANVPMLGLPAVPRSNKVINQLFGGTTAGEAMSASYQVPYRPTSPVARGMSASYRAPARTGGYGASYAAPYSMTEGLSGDVPAGSGMSSEASVLSEVMNV